MQNTSLAFGILIQIQILNWKHLYILDFLRSMELCIKRIKVRYTEFIISLSLLKGTVDINQNGVNEYYIYECFYEIFNFKI